MLQELSLEFFRGLAQPEPNYPTKKNSKAPSSRIALFTTIHYSKLLNVCQGETCNLWSFVNHRYGFAATLLFFTFFLIFLFFPAFVRSQTKNPLIVEVQIAGDSSNNDFIKIYNPHPEELNISGYKIRKRNSTGKEYSVRVLPEDSLIKSEGYFIWANSGDGFSGKIVANASSSQTLAKNNSIALYNPDNLILDALSWGESQNSFVEGRPFPENPGTNQQLKRRLIDSVFQDTNDNSNDFYLSNANVTTSPTASPEASAFPISLPTPTPTPFPVFSPTPIPTVLPTPTPSPTPLPTITPAASPLIDSSKQNEKDYPSGIIFNEILPSPEGPDETEEWIEIFNQNNTEVDISNWQITDRIGKITTYTIPEGTKIKPNGFLVLSRESTKIVLNNDGDELDLLQPDTKIVDLVAFEKAPQNQSYSRKEKQWNWSFTLTPGDINIITENPKTENKVEGLKETSQPRKETEEKTKEFNKENLASLGEQFGQNRFTKKIVFIALIIAVLSVIMILFLKSRLTKNNSDL